MWHEHNFKLGAHRGHYCTISFYKKVLLSRILELHVSKVRYEGRFGVKRPYVAQAIRYSLLILDPKIP